MSVEATIATWRLSKKAVTSTEKLFLLSCANRADEIHECWPSIKRLSADTGMDRKTIVKIRQSVMDKGLLTYTGCFKGRTGQIPIMKLTYVDYLAIEYTEESKRYTIKSNSPKNGTVKKSNSPKNGTCNSPKNGTLKQSQKRYSESKRKNLKEEPNNPPKSPKGGCERFEDFWSIYPIKKAKDSCLNKWQREKLDLIADEIIAKLDMQILNDRAWIEGFIPNPLTYLNGKRWQDEIDMRPRGASAKQQSTDNFHQTMAKQPKSKTGYYDELGNFTEGYL